MMAGTVAAQPAQQAVSATEGIINFAPDSPLYGVETTVDSFTQSKSKTIQERSAEYRKAAEQVNSTGAQNALKALNNALKKVPAEAEPAIQRAIENVRAAGGQNIGTQNMAQQAVANLQQAEQQARQAAQAQQKKEAGGSNTPPIGIPNVP